MAALEALHIACFIGVPVAAVLLRAAIALHGTLVGGAPPSRGVMSPALPRAMGIAALQLVLSILVGLTLGLLAALLIGAAGGRPEQARGIADVLSYPVGLVVQALLLQRMLPTSLRRAYEVVGCQLLVGLVVGVGAAVVVLLLVLVAR